MPQNGFNLLDVGAYYQNVIKGIIVIAALTQIKAGPPSRLRGRAAVLLGLALGVEIATSARRAPVLPGATG